MFALVVAWLALGQAHAQDWDHRHAFAKSYYGLSLIGVPAMGEGLLVDEDVVMPWYLVFGWDIRPSERGDWWVLRTNLRIPPQLELDHDDHTWSLQHLEFNFIQLVVYPQRWKRAKDLAKAG